MCRWGIFLLACIGLAACANVTPTATSPTQAIVSGTDTSAPAATQSPTPVIVSITDTVTPLPTASPTPVSTQTQSPLNLQPQVVVLASGLPEPDDLLLMPDGSILISDVTDGTIRQYGLDGRLQVVVSGLNEPEGMALAPDGSLIIAEQGNNRLVRYDFTSKTLSPFLDLVNHTNNLGVDNIIGDGTALIVPDSPNGTVLAVSWDGIPVGQLASGLVRPTGAWVEADGNILVVDEYGNAVVRLHADGTLEKVAGFSTPDDVIEDASGNIFVITLGDNAIHVLPAGQGRDVVLVGGLSQPQGMVFDVEGNLVVTDPGHHELIKVIVR